MEFTLSCKNAFISVLCGNFPDHEIKNAPVSVVGQLEVRVKPHEDPELFARVSGHSHRQPGGEDGGKIDVELFLAREAERGRSLTLEVLERHNAHPHQIAPVDPLVALRYDGPYSQQERSLGCPVSTRPAAVVFPW